MQDIKPGAKSVHKSPQKSNTLNRQYTQKPVRDTQKKVVVNQTAKKTQLRTTKSQSVNKSPVVSRFAKKPLLNNSVGSIKRPKTPNVTPAKSDPTESDNRTKKKVKTPVKISAKERAINQALVSTPLKTNKKPKRTIKPKTKKRLIVSSSASVIFLVLVFVFIIFSLPTLSLHLANNQAGINARYPQTSPEGYDRSGNARFVNGSVVIPFSSKDKNTSFAITQTKTIWDVTKLKSEVKELSHDNFITTEYKGLTIFHYSLGSQYITTWINSDILYVISGNANLDPSQIRAIVDSLH